MEQEAFLSLFFLKFQEKYLQTTSTLDRLTLQKKQSSGDIFADLNTSKKAKLESLKMVAEKLDRLLTEKGITEDELVEEFRQLRQEHNLK